MTTPTSLWAGLAESARRFPDKPAVRFYGSALSYGELVRQAEALAGWLQHTAHVRKGDRVLLMLPPAGADETLPRVERYAELAARHR